jgi:cellulose synthase/poly-beta-1,6-N-acetylglucosamine synthase-like glycosyltransferase
VNRRLLSGPVIGAGLAMLVVAWVGLAMAATIVGLLITILYLAFFVRHLLFAISALDTVHADLAAPVIEPPSWPSVSVLVSCHNEQAVAQELTRALGKLDYPPDLLQVIIVDDGSADRTGELLQAWAATGAGCCIRRPAGSPGGKSGALNAALEHVTGDIVVIFDADHRPHADVLRHLVRHFADPTVAAAQGRCVIDNARDSWLAHLVAIDYAAGYLVNEYGRQAIFGLPAYGGANCAVRTSALRALGGWHPMTVTEDTDLTLRLLLSGYRVRYDVKAVDEEEGVVTLGAYWRQRYRWSRGHQQVWRDFHLKVWASPHLSLTQKIETAMFLFAFHLPVVSAFSLALLGLSFGGVVQPPLGPLSLYVFSLLMLLGPLLELGTGLLLSGAPGSEARYLVMFLPLFLVSIALCTKSWIDGICGRDYRWVKTSRAGDVLSAASQAAPA